MAAITSLYSSFYNTDCATPTFSATKTIEEDSKAAEIEINIESSKVHSITGHDKTADQTPSIRRRHYEASDDNVDKQLHQSKKARTLDFEILPRVRQLRAPRRMVNPNPEKFKCWDRDHNRKRAIEKTMLQSRDQIEHIKSLVKIRNAYQRKSQVLRVIRGPSMYEDPSVYFLQQPIDKTLDLHDVCAHEPLKHQSALYAFLENGNYRFNLTTVAYDILPQVEDEVEAHDKWLDQTKMVNAPYIQEYIRLAPEHRKATPFERNSALSKLQSWPEENFLNSVEEKCRAISFPIPRHTMLLENQLAMSIATAASSNPIPQGTASEEIAKLVETVQRKGIEEHRAHHRRYMYWWARKVKQLQARERAECRDRQVESIAAQDDDTQTQIEGASARRNAARKKALATWLAPGPSRSTGTLGPGHCGLSLDANLTCDESCPFDAEARRERFAGGAASHRDPAAASSHSVVDPAPASAPTDDSAIDPRLLAAGTEAFDENPRKQDLLDFGTRSMDLGTLGKIDWGSFPFS